MTVPHVVILGAGPAGLGAAYQLSRLGRARVTVLEQRPVVGGNAGSFEFDGQRLDYGSHRLHPACDPEILADIKRLLGSDLLDRPRHGRIHLCGRWIHFPLKPVDLVLRADRLFALGTLRDMLLGVLPSRQVDEESFGSVLRASLGRTICDNFYFPYARKIWGHDPYELSAIQARRRVSAGSFAKLVRKVLAQVPGLKRPGAGRFYYPRNSYGQISEKYADAAQEHGADLRLGCAVSGLTAREGDVGWVITVQEGEREDRIEADYVWSTIPITLLARLVDPPPATAVRSAAESICFRSMVLVYLQLPVPQFTEYDAHYFPDERTSITRLSEPKNYSGGTEPVGKTTLCAELPCSPEDPWWSMSDEQVADVVAGDLRRVGLPLPVEPSGIRTKRLSHAYPIYLQGYEKAFDVLDEWVSSLPHFLSYGRQGLFAHDNTHHALSMAYKAVECLVDGHFDADRWEEYRKVFETHVVED